MTRFALAAAVLVLAAGCSEVCETDDVRATNVCVPAQARADSPLTLQINLGCSGCRQIDSGCHAQVISNRIVLEGTRTTCSTPGDMGVCTMACGIDVVDCALPALAEGDYEVIVGGAKHSVLAVRATGETRCTLDPFR